MTTTAQTARDLQNESLDQRITFEDGLVGCHDWKHFQVIVDGDAELPVIVLQSLDDPTVSLLVTDPTFLTPTYEVRLTADDRADLGLYDNARPTVFCTLSTGHDGWLTANLLGPLVVNPQTRRAKQIVLADSTYSTRYPIAQLATDRGDACSS